MNNEYALYQRTTRRIIDDYYKAMFMLIKGMFNGNVDKGIEYIIKSKTFEDFVRTTGWKSSVEKVNDFMRDRPPVIVGYSSLPEGIAVPLMDDFPDQIVSFVVYPETKEILLNPLTDKYLKNLFALMKRETAV